MFFKLAHSFVVHDALLFVYADACDEIGGLHAEERYKCNGQTSEINQNSSELQSTQKYGVKMQRTYSHAII